MNYTEKKQKNGLLMLIDFEKAFDSISWKFIYTVLKHYNFSNEFIKWINIFNSDISAAILQVGVLSDFFPMKRGCKQGDPIAPYLFIICAQLLCEMILTNTNINGIKLDQMNSKSPNLPMTQHCLWMVQRAPCKNTMNVLVFGSLSGLKMNLSKTKVIWIGKKSFVKRN